MRRNIDQGSSLKQALEIANIPAWAVKLVETANTGTLDNMFGEIALL
jgi:type II secretory pathway component PulF